MMRTCQACNKPFIARRDAKYCSDTCRQQAYRTRQSSEAGVALQVQLRANVEVRANIEADKAQTRADDAQHRADDAQTRADHLQSDAKEAYRYAHDLAQAIEDSQLPSQPFKRADPLLNGEAHLDGEAKSRR